MFMQCLYLFGVLFLIILYFLLACVLRIVDEQYEEYPAQFAKDSEQQFFEEGKCP
jgi:hypothetical protein